MNPFGLSDEEMFYLDKWPCKYCEAKDKQIEFLLMLVRDWYDRNRKV